MRFLFVSAELPGHLDWGGYLLTAAALAEPGRGSHEVLWASGQQVQPLLESHAVPGHTLAQTGWRWPPPPPLDPDDVPSKQAYQRLRMVRSLDQWLEVERVAQAVDELKTLAEDFKPDVICSEMFVAAAGIVAELIDVPFVVVGWPALRTRLSGQARQVADMAQERLDALCQRFDIHAVNWERQGPPALLSPHLHLTYWSPSWFDGLPLLPQTETVGGRAPDSQPWKTPWLSKLPMDQPWIFITLGTSFSRDPNFFIAAAHAAVQAGGLPIIAVGDSMGDKKSEEMIERMKEKLPGSTVVTGPVNFGEVLPYAAAAIHHGGAGTTHALVTHAVPQIVVPHAADQARQGEGVARSGVGYRVAPRKVTVQLLATMLEQVLPNNSPVRQNARSLKEEFASLGGVPRAATLLEKVGSEAGR